ncbi:MAG: hypothetical protein ACT4PW_02220 [Acidimicrobiia bacterium]
MSGRVNQRASLGQDNGPEVELIVNGSPFYATYHTPDGYPAIYDDDLGLYVYARLADGRFESTGVPVGSPPPPDGDRSAAEADHVRAEKISARQAHLDQYSHDQQGRGGQ